MKYLQLVTLYSNMLKNFYEEKNFNDPISLIEVQNQIKNEYIESHRWQYYLSKKKFEVKSFIANDYFSQHLWCKENEIKIRSKKNWYFEIIFSQIEKFKPNILFLSSEALLNASEIKFLKKRFSFLKKIILWVGVLNSTKNLDLINNVDTIFTSSKDIYIKLKPYKDVQQINFAFDRNILNHLDNEKKNEIIFLGNIFLERSLHGLRCSTLKYLTKNHKIKIYSNLNSYSLKNYIKNFIYKLFQLSDYKDFKIFKEINFYSNINSLKKINYADNLYGLKQFKKLNQYSMVLNIHANNIYYSSNVRLFEATGVGSCLFTENSKNITDLFDVNDEIITFNDKEDLNDKINYFKNHPKDVKKIGLNAQKKIIKNHTFEKRIEEFENKITIDI